MVTVSAPSPYLTVRLRDPDPGLAPLILAERPQTIREAWVRISASTSESIAVRVGLIWSAASGEVRLLSKAYRLMGR